MKPSDFRPSSSPRFMVCPGSVVLSAGKPDSSSEYAKAGSAQHKQAEMLMRKKLFGEDFSEVVTNESVLGYVEWATSLVQPGDTVLIEQRVSTADVLGVPNASGTLDFAILRADEKSILIADRKFPWGKPVYAAGDGEEGEEEGEEGGEGMLGHPPLMIYALGAIDSFDGLFIDKAAVEEVEFAIYQENAGRSGAVDTWKCTVKYLESFRSMAKAAVRRATVAETHYGFIGGEPGDDARWAKEYLRPGNTQCKYCKAKADLSCPAVSVKVLNAIAVSRPLDMDDWELKLAGLEDGKMEELYELLPLVADWMKAVKFQMYMRMQDMGAEMKRHKLVEGRMGNRKWMDKENMEIGIEEAYERVLLDPPAIEKKVKKGVFPKDVWDNLQPFIERKPGKPTIAKKADEREVVSLPAVEEIPCDLLPPVL